MRERVRDNSLLIYRNLIMLSQILQARQPDQGTLGSLYDIRDID